MVQPAAPLTLERYIELERRGEVKHEYVDGVAHAMAGGTVEHGEIAANVIRHLGTVLRDRSSHVYTSDVRIAVEVTGLRTYPDATVVRGEVRRTDEGLSVVNPVLLIEVLSDSTEHWDRGGKFAHYRRIPSLREYVVIAQDERFAEHHEHVDGGLWTLRDVRGAGVVKLSSLGCDLPLDEVYLKVAVAV